jgi:hypothetical protein
MSRLHNQTGFALLSVLIFMEIFITLSLFAVHSASQNLKITHQLYLKNKMQLTANNILFSVERNISPDCLLTEKPHSKWHDQPIAWWQIHSCNGKTNSFEYYYVIQPLETDPCAKLNYLDIIDTPKVAQYFRITLLIMFQSDPTVTQILQSTAILPTDPDRVCTGSIHTVFPGRQSVREV